MSRLRAAHDPYVIEGGCSCPGTRTLFQARIEGHTAECTQGRREQAEAQRRTREIYESRSRPIGQVREIESRRDVG